MSIVNFGSTRRSRRLARWLLPAVLMAVVAAGCAQLMADSIEALMKQGIDLFSAGKYDAAIGKFLEVVQRDPKSWSAYLYLARAYVAKGAWADAVASGRKALELAPNSGDVVPTLAQAFLGAGTDALGRRQFSEAAGHFLEYVKLRPTDFQGYLNLARAYLGSQSWLDAITNGRKAFELAPGGTDVVPVFAQALLGGGLDALGQRQFSTAVAHLGEYVKLRPGDWQGYLQLGRAFLGTGAYGNAVNVLGQGLAQTSDPAGRQQLTRGLLDGGGQALAAGNAKAAIGLLQEYVRHDASNVSAYLDLGKAYWQDGSLGNALGAFRRVLELNPNDPEALQFLGGRR
jgi:tetratricopeptide (TPR) repeat protein